MTPALGQLWRASATGSLYEVEKVDPSHPDVCQRIGMRLVEAGPALRSEWWAEETQEVDRSLHDARHPMGSVEEHCRTRLLMVEPAWFEHGAATFEGYRESGKSRAVPAHGTAGRSAPVGERQPLLPGVTP